MEDFEIEDYGDIVNALTHGDEIGDGVVNMTMSWSGRGEVSEIRDADNGFTGRKVTGTSRISWNVVMEGFSFTAETAGQTSVVSEVWKLRNGVFFS